MPEVVRKQINYMVVCVSEFARAKALHPRIAFQYLYGHKGIDFLKEQYEVEHILSIEDAVEDLNIICKKKYLFHPIKRGLMDEIDIFMDSCVLASIVVLF